MDQDRQPASTISKLTDDFRDVPQAELERGFNKLMAVRQLADNTWREVCEQKEIGFVHTPNLEAHT